MKLTQPVYKQHYGFWFKNIWRKKSRFNVRPVSVPKPLVEAGIKPVDAVETFFSKPKQQVWIPPNDPRFMFPLREEDDRNYNTVKALTFNNQIRIWEGVKQIQILTNTVVNEGLPSQIVESAEVDMLNDQDHHMQRILLQANLWDTTRESLPRRKKPDDISLINYKAEFGIPLARNIDILLSGLALKCAQATAYQDPSNAAAKRLIKEHCLNTSFMYNQEPVYLCVHSNALLCSKNYIPRYATVDQVIATEDLSVPDIFPMSPTLDLVRSNVYDKQHSIGYTQSLAHQNHHTLFLSMEKDWTMDQRQANALLISYAHCIQQARRKPQLDLSKEPICIHTIHTDGEQFGYTCFQLNTLETKTDVGQRKNMAWIDNDRLFNKVVPRRSMLRNTKYSEYNGNVIRKILAMYSR